MTARIGVLDLQNEKSYDFKIKSFKWSGMYNSTTVDYDIAILYTTTDIYNSTFKVLNATYLISDYGNPNVTPYLDYLVYGWGRINTNGPSSNKLLKTALTVMDQSTCRKYWGRSLTDRMFCASKQNHAFCNVSINKTS